MPFNSSELMAGEKGSVFVNGTPADRAEGSGWTLRSSCALVPGEMTTQAGWAESRVCVGPSVLFPRVDAVSV